MEQYFEILEKCPLFKGVERNELSGALKCLEVKIKEYKKVKQYFCREMPLIFWSCP